MSIEGLRKAIVDGDDDTSKALTEKLLADGSDPMTLLEEAVKPALAEVSEGLNSKELFIPDLILSGEAAKACMNQLAPLLAKQAGGKSIGKVVIGVVEGDTHDIGKDLVRSMLIAAGFDVVDLETNVAPNHFIEAINAHKPQIVAASAYTSASAAEIGRLIEALTAAGVRDKVKVLIGGAAVYRDDVTRFDADDFGHDAAEAVVSAKRMVGAR